MTETKETTAATTPRTVAVLGGQVLRVEYEGPPADYLHAIYVDSLASIASGREIGAFPKKLGAPSLDADSDTLVGTLDDGTLRVATATMGFKHAALPKEAALEEITAPTCALKIVPGYDRRPRVLQLVRSEITDISVKEAWTGPARLQLFEQALAPMADLPVREVVAASHIRVDLTLAPFAPVLDYLAQAAEARA